MPDLAALVVATASTWLVGRLVRRHRPLGWRRSALAPLAAVITAAVAVIAAVPAGGAPALAAPAASVMKVGSKQKVPGAGGAIGQKIVLPAFSPSSPLRVTVFGDSVAEVAAPGIAAALGATGEVTVSTNAIGGFGLNIDATWASPTTGIAAAIGAKQTQLVLATWSWDDSCTPKTPTPDHYYKTYVCALQHPKEYTQMLEQAVRLMLTPGGASGVIFLQFPTTGPDAEVGETSSDDPSLAGDLAGERAWNKIVESLPAVFPGKVMYLPVGSSVLLDGTFTPWLPPSNDPAAPKSQWVRVRMTDGVHLCPAGAARYGNAVLADLTDLYHLAPATPGWPTQSWTASSVYTPGNCPDDHPPG